MKSLLESRKFWISIVSSVSAAAVGITGMILHADKDYVIAIMGALVALPWKLIDGIAREDAAKAMPVPQPPMAQSAGTIINQGSTPPPRPDADEMTPTESLRSAGWPNSGAP